MSPTTTSWVIDPILPIPVIGLLGCVLVFLTVGIFRSVASALTPGRKTMLLVFRLVAIILVLALLLQPSRMEIIPPLVQSRVTLLAIDQSRSMKQQDVERGTRLDAARALVEETGILGVGGTAGDVRLFTFSDDAKPWEGSLAALKPDGPSTRVHRSVQTMLNSLANREAGKALVLLTDGHDFEMVNPAKTALAAKSRSVPIYAVPLGKQGRVRDVSTRITSFQPYCYVNQKARVAATLRLIGCEHETLQVQLLRAGQVLQRQRVNAEELSETTVEFQVTEPQTGQFEYEVRVVSVEDEADTSNNSAITYLNVIDQHIRVLVLEGSPYWDTTFLQRSLMRNDKFEVDSLVQYADQKIRPIQKGKTPKELRVPNSAKEFREYEVVVLGRSVERLLNASQLELLQKYVRDEGATVVFSRGPAFDGPLAGNDLEPVLWKNLAGEKIRLQMSREGQALSPLGAVGGGAESLPELLAVRQSGEKKPLTATLATASDADHPEPVPAVVHRRYGEGQVVSVGVEGLWRWAFHAKVDGPNNAFDRFWDQLILWLLAARDVTPSAKYSFRTSSGNVALGEKVYFRLNVREAQPGLKSVPVQLYLGDKEAARLMLTAAGEQSGRFVGEFTPEKLGRYRGVVTLPDGTKQESRFMAYSENTEETEVSTDVAYLKRLCEASGGRLLEPAELGPFLRELKDEKVESAPRTRLKSAWDKTWIFYLIGLLYGAEWYLRRRWGLS